MSDVFISYSRKDIAFARLIRESLQQSQIDTWIDWERIPVGERWWQEICEAIQNANVFMFIISQNSIGSKVCKEEIELALQNNKRIIPIVVDNLKPEAIQEFAPYLPQFNWIIFERDHIFRLEENSQAAGEKPEDRLMALPQRPQFEQALEKLSAAIHTDWEWVKYHTRLQVDALRWENNLKNPSYLLRGAELEEAEQHLFRAAGKEPQPSELQVNYVTASRQEETQRQAEQLALEQKSRRRQQMVLWTVGIGLLVAVILGVAAWGQRNQYLSETHVRATAEANAVTEANNRATAEANAINEANARATAQANAEIASTQAVQQRDEAERQALIAIASKLDTDSSTMFANHFDLGLLLSAEAYNLIDNSQTQAGLLNALQANPRAARYISIPDPWITSIFISPDGRLLAIGHCTKENPEEFARSAFACLESSIEIFEMASGDAQGEPITGLKGNIRQASFSPDGSSINIVTSYGIYAVNVSDRQISFFHPFSSGEIILVQAAFSPDGKTLVLGDCGERGSEGEAYCSKGLLGFWNLARREFYGPTQLVASGRVDALAYHPGGNILAANIGNTGTVLFDVSDPGQPQILSIIPTYLAESLAFSPEGNLLVVSTWEKDIQFWDTSDPRSVVSYGKSLSGLDSVVMRLAVSPDGQTLAAGSCGKEVQNDCKQGEVRLWQLAPQYSLGTAIGMPMTGFEDYASQLYFSPDGKTLASSDGISTILWDVTRDQPLEKVLDSQTYRMTFTAAFSPDGQKAAWNLNNDVGLWDLGSGEPISLTMTGHTSELEKVTFSTDGKTLLTASENKTVIRWDAQTGEMVDQPIVGHELFLFQLSVMSIEGQRVAYTNADGTISIVDLTTGQPVIAPVMYKNPNALAFSKDGKILAASRCEQKEDNQCLRSAIRLWDTKTGEQGILPDFSLAGNQTVMVFSPNEKELAAAGDGKLVVWDLSAAAPVSETLSGPAFPVTALAYSSDGKTLASGGCAEKGEHFCNLGEVRFWDVQTHLQVGEPITGHVSNIISLTFSPDGKFLVTTSRDDTFILWDVSSRQSLGSWGDQGRIILQSEAHNSVTFSQDGKLLVFGRLNGSILIWDTSLMQPDGEPLYVHREEVQAVGLSPDGKILYSFGKDRTLHIWDMASRQVTVSPVAGYMDMYAYLAFSPGGNILAAGSCRFEIGDQCIQIEINFWDTTTGQINGQPVEISTQENIHLLEFSPDGRILVVGYCSRSEDLLCQQSHLNLYDADTHQLLGEPVKAQGDDLNALVFSPDGKKLAAADSEGNIWIWNFDLNTQFVIGEPQVIILSSPQSLAFSPDGQYLAIGGIRQISLWDLDLGSVFGQPLITSNVLVYTIAYSPDGKYLLSGDNSGVVNLWDLDPAHWYSLACTIANRNLTEAEWKIYMGDRPYHKTCPGLP